jgi:hypothetical protein
MLFLGYFAFGKEALSTGSESLSLHNGGPVGLGLHGGALLGDYERVAIQFSVQGSGLGGLFLFTAVGVGFPY